MKNLIKHKVFIAAFLLTYFLFFVLTINFALAEISAGGTITLGSTNYGFPFVYYSSHCFGGNYLWSGLIGNIFAAAILSFIVGLISAHFWLKFLSPEFRAKWYL